MGQGDQGRDEMYLRIIGQGFTENIFREIAALTDRAKLHIREVTYERERETVVLPIDRFRVTRAKKPFRFLPYKQDYANGIRSTVTIRNVRVCEIEDNSPEHTTEVTLMFGITIDSDKIFAGSAEEGVGDERGKAWYGIDMEVSAIDIEIKDLSEKDALRK